jgi:cell division transport system ATP-binding protein
MGYGAAITSQWTLGLAPCDSRPGRGENVSDKAAQTDLVVQLDNVGLRYGRGPEILQDISLSLASGSFHFLTGASGAGKSSLLRMMYLAHRPSRGRVLMFGQDTAKARRNQLPALRRRIGVVFQDFHLLDHLSTLDNVALPLRIAGASERDVQKFVPDLLHWVGLAEQIDARPSTLSGGQKQRVAIARAVIGRPDLLLADEPTGSVDDAIAVRLMHLFEELNKLGTAIILATHNEALVAKFAHPRLQLENGKLART